jgi:hypothetical protein
VQANGGGEAMSVRKTWIKGKMHFPPDVDPADIDWVVPLAVANPKPFTQNETKKETEIQCSNT